MRDVEEQELETDFRTEEACAKMWSVYISQAERYDKALVAGWRADMKGILIFAGLFSASLTSFIIESYRTLTPDSGNTAVLILAQISRQLESPSAGTVVPIAFAPATSALVCNGLWFTSLGLSLASAVIATLVEQWARDYLNKADMRPSPIERARICSYLYSGLKRFRMHAVVDLIPLLLHMSLLLFFAGLVAFLYPINRAMTFLAAALLGVVALVYAMLTAMPLLFGNSPCRTPLSGVLWRIRHISQALYSALRRGAKSYLSMEDVMMDRATAASARRTERDRRALCWTLKSLTAEHELEPFVEAIPQVIWAWTPLARRRAHDPLLQTLVDDPGVQLGPRIASLLSTCENGLLEPGARQHRTVLCLKALLAFAMAAETGPARSLDFPFELSTLAYLARTDYAPAQPYLPALRACGVWSLFCSVLASAERVLAACNAEGKAKRELRLELLLPGLRETVKLAEDYMRARGPPFFPGRSELVHLVDAVLWIRVDGLGNVQHVLQRLLDTKPSVQLDLLRSFLLDSARSDYPTYSFKETVAILRPAAGILPAPQMPPTLGPTFRAIVERAKDEPSVTHVDRALAVYLPLLDSTTDAETEHCATDALITYFNARALSAAALRVLHDCDVALVWARVVRRLARRDQPDEVLAALWRLCDLFLDPGFAPQLGAISLESLVETAAELPVSQYTASVAAMLRTVALHAAEAVHIPNVAAKNTSTKLSLGQLAYLSASALLPAPVTDDVPAADAAVPALDPADLRARISAARLALLIEFMGPCASAIPPYNAAHTLAHIGAGPAPPRPARTDLQALFAARLRSLVKAAGDERLLQTVLECALVGGLQWLDGAATISAVRRALEGAFLAAREAPGVVDALGRLRVVEDMCVLPGADEVVADTL
ncbi:hypothetical protein B0H17DRAFT_1181607 [Mycena rosella]|uniref:DUF6535 domain-containing protein n=1 Tax=Mycena rosella TaxID=1033263 RepID=A0AAD7GFA1_MYCRO|nr:hypothetical protein B0H17DRAFT_1181607 [Mycena rosella]